MQSPPRSSAWFPVLLLASLGLAIVAAIVPSPDRASSLIGAGIAYADSCDTCRTWEPPVPIYDPEGPNP